jgi:hypothetical protein
MADMLTAETPDQKAAAEEVGYQIEANIGPARRPRRLLRRGTAISPRRWNAA